MWIDHNHFDHLLRLCFSYKRTLSKAHKMARLCKNFGQPFAFSSTMFINYTILSMSKSCKLCLFLICSMKFITSLI